MLGSIALVVLKVKVLRLAVETLTALGTGHDRHELVPSGQTKRAGWRAVQPTRKRSKGTCPLPDPTNDYSGIGGILSLQ